LAKQAEKQLGEFPKRKTAAASPEGTRTLSGWSKKNGFEQVTDEVFDLTEKLGKDLKKHAFDQGVLGRYFSSHAEKQLAALGETDALAVSRVMCGDCQEFFQKFAFYKKRSIVVLDPETIRVFRADGSVVPLLR
jgi:hypothetical protein